MTSRDFPLLEKADVLENFSKLVSANIHFRNAYVDSTGGSSGKQLRFYVSNSLYAIEWAYITSLWQRVGYELGDRIVAFKGGSNRFGNQFWRYEPVFNALAMSPFQMNTQTLPLYLERIRKWKPKFVYGYPSAITIISKYILENNEINLPSIKAILLCSEKVYFRQSELIEKAFHARAFSWYGQSEKVILGGECEHSKRYHIFPQYGFTELIGKDGSVMEESGEAGELVGTGFYNFAMPLIRYRTDDYATLSRDQKCICGRHCTILESVSGRRLQEMVVGKRGSLISLAALNIHTEELDKLYDYQFYQDHVGGFVIKIKPGPSFVSEDKQRIMKTFKSKVGNELDISIDCDSEIELTPMGKTKLLIQKLDLSEWWASLGK